MEFLGVSGVILSGEITQNLKFDGILDPSFIPLGIKPFKSFEFNLVGPDRARCAPGPLTGHPAL